MASFYGKGLPVNQEFERCLESKKIVPFANGKNLVKKEVLVAGSDLSDARAGYGNERYKWATIQAYYAMFHAARALIYSKGYREKGHYCVAVALRSLFVDEGTMDAQSVRDLLSAMHLRDRQGTRGPGQRGTLAGHRSGHRGGGRRG